MGESAEFGVGGGGDGGEDHPQERRDLPSAAAHRSSRTHLFPPRLPAAYPLVVSAGPLGAALPEPKARGDRRSQLRCYRGFRGWGTLSLVARLPHLIASISGHG